MSANKEQNIASVAEEKNNITPLIISLFLFALCLCALFSAGQGYYKDITAAPAQKVEIAALKKAPKRSEQDAEIKFRKFYITAPGAKEVQLLADFNGFGKTPIILDVYRKGYFDTSIALAEGEYKYIFLVDGKEVLDVTNPDVIDFDGRKVCVKTVR